MMRILWILFGVISLCQRQVIGFAISQHRAGQTRATVQSQAFLVSPHDQRRNQLPPYSSFLSLSASDEDDYFIRNAVLADMRFCAQLLADGFHADKSWFQRQFEKLETYLSLESAFPSEWEQHEMFVASDGQSRVVAFCEINNKMSLNANEASTRCNNNESSSLEASLNPRPYMYNLAVDPKCRRRGLAMKMIATCEAHARDEWKEEMVHLKVREDNKAAVKLYSNSNYAVVSKEIDTKIFKGETLLIMSKKIDASAAKGNEGRQDKNLPVVTLEEERSHHLR